MATTSIWRVKGWLGKVVIYVENPDKTSNGDFFRDSHINVFHHQTTPFDYRLSRFRLRRNSRSRSRIMVSSICWGVVPLGKYFRSLSMPILTVSF